MKKTLRIALAGNPNCGKTTLFNKLTGSNQYVGNWPGVTVEKKEGIAKFQDYEIHLVDLPGIYSLSPYSPEEIVTRNFLIEEDPDLIINIVDATNIERNLYLTTQIAELGVPTIVALNMMDVIEKAGDHIDVEKLKENFQLSFVPISANKGAGTDDLLKTAVATVSQKNHDFAVKKIYSAEIETALAQIATILHTAVGHFTEHLRWTAVKLLEGDNITQNNINLPEAASRELYTIKHGLKVSMDLEMVIADQRYRFICSVCEQAIHKTHPVRELTISDKIDRVLTNKYLVIPIFFAAILLIFTITFGPVGTFLADSATWLIEDLLAPGVSALMIQAGASSWAISLVVRGVIGGVGAVVSFLPQILLLFALLSILEDSGYMARAAFITDQLLRKIGLSGRAFVPMLMGFGCTVPAVMGTRILESQKDKRLTVLITPFMSCSAKMPVYSMFI
ncbi:MAG: ferrous iron transport protein B, partial [Oscillospiraceae bacterium]